MTISMIKKDWYPHRNMRTPFRKGMESTFDFEATQIPQLKTKQRIGLQNKPEQTYDRDFVRSFHGGAHTGSIAPSCTRQYTWHTKRPRVGIAKDSLRHNETIVKPTVNRRTTRRRTPISYHTSVGKISKELLEFPPMKLPKLSRYAIRCWGYRGSIISHPN